MDFSFAEALRALGRYAAFQIINGARPASEYLLATLLPEDPKPTYYVDAGFMTVRTTMAGLAGMSSPYSPGGVIEASTFLEKSAKIAQEVTMEEEALRTLQEILRQRGLAANSQVQFLATEALNFYDKLIVQAHMDTAEWLRAQCLMYGNINWTFNKMNLNVDYGVPVAFLPAKRTGSDAYDNTASKFWTDHYAALEALYYNVRCIILNGPTMLKMLNNPVNNFQVINMTQNADGTGIYTVRRFRPAATAGASPVDVISNDARDTVSFITYDNEGEVLDPSDTSKTQRIKFIDDGVLVYVANNRSNGYRVGEGATRDPIRDMALGYTHIAPTVEGGGMMGRWGDMRVPEDRPWAISGRGVTNLLPVRMDVSETLAKTYTLQTELS